MDRQQKLRTYDNVMAALVVLAVVAMLLSSCASTRNTGHQDHLRSTPTNNWVRHDNGGCAWNR